MRLTVTLDQDVVDLLTRVREQRGYTQKRTINEALRLGLADLLRAESKKPFRTKTVGLGQPLFSSVADLKRIMAEIEFEDDYRNVFGTAPPDRSKD
jgi:hypothetical protein